MNDLPVRLDVVFCIGDVKKIFTLKIIQVGVNMTLV
jgi:hypothetical protein